MEEIKIPTAEEVRTTLNHEDKARRQLLEIQKLIANMVARNAHTFRLDGEVYTSNRELLESKGWRVYHECTGLHGRNTAFISCEQPRG